MEVDEGDADKAGHTFAESELQVSVGEESESQELLYVEISDEEETDSSDKDYVIRNIVTEDAEIRRSSRGLANLVNNVYKLETKISPHCFLSANVVTGETWHRRLGHLNSGSLNKMKMGSVDGLTYPGEVDIMGEESESQELLYVEISDEEETDSSDKDYVIRNIVTEDAEIRRSSRAPKKKEFEDFVVRIIIDEIRDDISSKTDRNHALSPEDMVFLTLRFLATGCFLQVTGDFCGVDKSTASRVVHKVTRAIAHLKRSFIKLSEEDLISIRQ
ncbi:hypothetical protein NQ314_017485, partial [Rhamnusium bicolor]